MGNVRLGARPMWHFLPEAQSSQTYNTAPVIGFIRGIAFDIITPHMRQGLRSIPSSVRLVFDYDRTVIERLDKDLIQAVDAIHIVSKDGVLTSDCLHHADQFVARRLMLIA